MLSGKSNQTMHSVIKWILGRILGQFIMDPQGSGGKGPEKFWSLYIGRANKWHKTEEM